MPGEEQDDIVMTSTQCNLLNITCPLSGKPVVDLAEPVRRYSLNQFKVFLFSYSRNSFPLSLSFLPPITPPPNRKIFATLVGDG